MKKLIDFKKYNPQKFEEYNSYYLEKLGIQVISQYDNKEKRSRTESFLK